MGKDKNPVLDCGRHLYPDKTLDLEAYI